MTQKFPSKQINVQPACPAAIGERFFWFLSQFLGAETIFTQYCPGPTLSDVIEE